MQSHNKVICGQKIKNLRSNFLTTIPNSLTTDRGRSVAMLRSLRLTFKKRGLHGSLTRTSIVQICVGTNAVCERRYGCASFPSLFSATGRRNSIGFRPRRTPADVVSRSLPRSRPHTQQSTGAPLERGTKKHYPILHPRCMTAWR